MDESVLDALYAQTRSALHQVFTDRLHSHADFASLRTLGTLRPKLQNAYKGGFLHNGKEIVPASDVNSLLYLSSRLLQGEEGVDLQEALAYYLKVSPVLEPVLSADLL